jgi:hypothetical protein
VKRSLFAILFFSLFPSSAGAVPCGKISKVGCCLDDRLLFCEDGKLSLMDCRKKPRCGFRPSKDPKAPKSAGIYDCDTAGNADPSGFHGRLCLFEKGQKPPLEIPPTPSRCGKVTEEGCCFGNELRFCERGKLRRINCDNNRYCGWRGVAQVYNCGTDGNPDPRKKYPRDCPGAPLFEKRIKATPATATDFPAKPPKAKKRTGGCAVAEPASPAPWLLFALALCFGARRCFFGAWRHSRR